MFEVVYNIIVMVVFGFLIGAMIAVSVMFEKPEKRSEAKRNPGESPFGYLRRCWKEEGKEGSMEGILEKYRKAYKITLYLLTGVVVIMVLLVRFSPIGMHWGAFIIAIFVSAGILLGIYNLAKTGKISVKNRFFDIPSEEELPK
jgi:hypothetical protein